MSDLHRRLYSVAYNFSLPNTGSEVILSDAYSVFRGKEEKERNESSNNGILSALESKGMEET